jgi:hypothetical protein
MENTRAKIGQGLLPLYQKLLSAILPVINAFTANSEIVSKIIIVVLAFTSAIIALNYAIKAVTIITTTYNAVVVVATAVQTAFNAVLLANPIGLVVIAIAALVAGIILAYKKSETFQEMVQTLWDVLKKMGNFIKDVLVGYFEALFRIVDKVRDVIVDLVKKLKDSPLGSVLGSIVDRVTGGRAVGGTVRAGQAVRVGELGSEVFIPGTGGQIIPHNKLGGGGTTIIMNGVIDAESARRSIERLLQNSARRTGAINLVGATL